MPLKRFYNNHWGIWNLEGDFTSNNDNVVLSMVTHVCA